MPTDFGRSPTDTAMGSQRPETLSALAQLIQGHRSLVSVEVLRLPIAPSVEDRPGAQPQHRYYADEARRVRHRGDSFTEAFLTAADRNNDLSSALAVVDYHQRFDDAPFSATVRRDDFTPTRITDLVHETPAGQMLVLTSRVETLEGPRHVPLLDFKISSSSGRNEEAVRSIAGRLGGGLLVDSGSSYHLYGLTLLDDQRLVDWLLHAQLFSRCVDTRWVTHQLIERRAALRLSPGGSRNAHPRLIAKIECDSSTR